MQNNEHSIDEVIPQNHTRGPGWFLILSYIFIAIFCIYYFFTYIDWQSDYDKQQMEIKEQISQTG